MVADVVEAQRARVVDEHAEQAAPARQVADGAVGVLVDAAREEAGELAAFLVEDAQRDVARAREVGGGLQEPVEHRLEVELGQQAAPGVDEAREPVLVQAVERRHARARAYRRACAATCGAPAAAAGTTSTGQAAWRRISSSRAGDDQHVDVAARLGHQRAGAAARDARRGGRRAPGPGRGPAIPRRQLVAGGDEPHVGADALGERRRERRPRRRSARAVRTRR